MNLHTLKPAPGSRHERKRVGRGISAGQGKTAGKGTKGQNARTGGGVRPGFEGGQTTIFRRIPKRGFDNGIFSNKFAVVNIADLNRFAAGTEVTPEVLTNAGLIDNGERVKILGNGELTVALTVKANAFSQSASEKIAAAGGKVEVL